MLRNIITLAIALIVATPALAGPGDARETARYRALLESLSLTCPAGSRLFVSGNASVGIEESCVTPEGIRNGYYLRWFADGQSWAIVGHFANGRRVGRWLRFDPEGRPPTAVVR